MRLFFFFNDTATTEIYTLSLHDALPIYQAFLRVKEPGADLQDVVGVRLRELCLHRVDCIYVDLPLSHPAVQSAGARLEDRKSTRLNSSHANISYAVFCLKKKKK